MAKTKTFTTDAGDIELRRPTFTEMRDLGEEARKLFEAESAQSLLFSDTFDDLMKTVAVTDDDYQRLVGECDIVDVWNVWTAFSEFARFSSFFVDAEASQAEMQEAMEQVQYGAASRRLEALKKLGLAPSDYSMADVMRVAGQEELPDVMQPRPAPSEAGSTKPSKKADTKK